MNFLRKTVFASSLLLCSGIAFAGSRNFVLDFATLNPADNNELDTRSSASTEFKASGNVVLDDDTGEVTRTLNLCNQGGCVKQSEIFTIGSYTEGISAVFLKNKADASKVKMTFIWNYQNMGFIEKLGAKWGDFANKELAISWKASSDMIPPDPKQKPAAYDQEFYVSTLNGWWVAKNEKDPELKKLYYQFAISPAGVWFDGVKKEDDPDPDGRLNDFLTKAANEAKTPILVIYGIPDRDCGWFSKGGHPDAASYRAWIDNVSSMIGDKKVVVVVEPDAIDYCSRKHDDPKRIERAELLTYVGKIFSANNPNAPTYLHAGSSDIDVNDAANAIIEGGVKYMRGFATNVAGNRGTEREQAWAEQLVNRLAELGVTDKYYVIDSSRNGVDNPAPRSPSFPSCNNFNAAMGARSTSETTGKHADAYVWVHGIGASDGECGLKDPPSGVWYPEYAQHLVRNALDVGSVKYIEPPADF